MSLFVDKHRPKSLDHLHYHEELSKRIRTLVRRRVLTAMQDTATLTRENRQRLLEDKTSLIYYSMALVVLARRRASIALCASYTDQEQTRQACMTSSSLNDC